MKYKDNELIEELVLDAVDTMRDAPTVEDMVSRIRCGGTPISSKLVLAAVRRLSTDGLLVRALGYPGGVAHYARPVVGGGL